MSNFEIILEIISEYLNNFDADVDKISSLHDISKNDSDTSEIYYVYNGENELRIINMFKLPT